MKSQDAYKTYLFMQGGVALLFSMVVTVNMVYQVEIAQLNPLQLVLVGTVLETTAFLFEVPTGIVADIYSRKLSIVIGFFLWGAGFVLEGLIPRFETILLAQVIWGIGATFTSGATEAWISDEIGEERAGKAFLRGSQFGQAGDLLGIPFGVALGSIMLQLPIVLGGALISLLAVCLVLIMSEHGFVPTPREDRNSFQQMAHTFRSGIGMVQKRPILATILGTIAIFGAFSEGFDRLWTPHLLDNFTFPTVGGLEPVVWFGIIRACGILISIGVVEWARRRVDTNSSTSVARTLFAVNTLLAVCVIAFGLVTNFPLAFLILLGIIPLRRINGPIQTAWVNQRLESHVRATVISMSSQADALGQIIGGPILGAIATVASTRVEMAAAGLMLTPALWLFARTVRGERPVTPAQTEPTD